MGQGDAEGAINLFCLGMLREDFKVTGDGSSITSADGAGDGVGKALSLDILDGFLDQGYERLHRAFLIHAD